jgi:small subunit ribosomal protein S20
VANIKQQKKRVRSAARQHGENLRYRSSIKTYFRRLQVAVESGDTAAVAREHTALQRLIDRAAAHRALHANTASRKKARAARLVAAGPQAEPAKKRTRKPAARGTRAPKASAA